MKELHSKIDASVNFVTPCEDGGFFESRYVRREKDYFICYLSSHSGCKFSCQFCWLTATKQTMMRPARHHDFLNQVEKVVKHYKTQEEARVIHFNWMARGEPLDNPGVDYVLLEDLASMAHTSLNRLLPKFNISTIMPKGFNGDLARRFSPIYPTIYYSLYSLNPEFRAKWMPGAMDPYKALDMLAQYQQDTKKIIYLHGAIIRGENDSYRNWKDIFQEIQNRNLLCKMNIVKYNPPAGSLTKEAGPDQLDLIKYWAHGHGISCKIVKPVDTLVRASCGQFVTAEEYEAI